MEGPGHGSESDTVVVTKVRRVFRSETPGSSIRTSGLWTGYGPWVVRRYTDDWFLVRTEYRPRSLFCRVRREEG